MNDSDQYFRYLYGKDWGERASYSLCDDNSITSRQIATENDEDVTELSKFPHNGFSQHIPYKDASLVFNERDWIVRPRVSVLNPQGVECWLLTQTNFPSVYVQRPEEIKLPHFHQFGDLPHEIRTEIFEYLLPAPRAMELTPFCFFDNELAETTGRIYNVEPHHLGHFDLILRKICKESQEVFDRHYTRIDRPDHCITDSFHHYCHQSNESSYTYFDSKHDVLVLNDQSVFRDDDSDFCPKFPNLDIVRNVLIDPLHFISQHLSTPPAEIDRIWRFCKDVFPRMKTLSLDIGCRESYVRGPRSRRNYEHCSRQMQIVPLDDCFVEKLSSCITFSNWGEDDPSITQLITQSSLNYFASNCPETEMASVRERFVQAMLGNPYTNSTVKIQVALMAEQCVPKIKEETKMCLMPRNPKFWGVWYFTKAEADSSYVADITYEPPRGIDYPVQAPYLIWGSEPFFIMHSDENGMPQCRYEGLEGLEDLFRQAEKWEPTGPYEEYEGVQDLFRRAERLEADARWRQW